MQAVSRGISFSYSVFFGVKILEFFLSSYSSRSVSGAQSAFGLYCPFNTRDIFHKFNEGLLNLDCSFTDLVVWFFSCSGTHLFMWSLAGALCT